MSILLKKRKETFKTIITLFNIWIDVSLTMFHVYLISEMPSKLLQIMSLRWLGKKSDFCERAFCEFGARFGCQQCGVADTQMRVRLQAS